MTEERYEIRGKIGQGGVGAVYKAYDTQLRREVAIKRVLADADDPQNDTATQNLLQEATSLSSVQHPHICTVYDAGIDDEGPFVVMELINGKTLDEMVEKGTLTYEDFREVAIQSQEAMIAAQELNIVHRDLKPSNVMVSWLPSGRFQIKLVDFGLAKFSAKPSLQTIDHGDAVFGSIFFMAPEQFERTPLDQRTDMYSLGAMFYYTLTGNYPFDGDSAPQVMASHLQGTVAPLQQIRPDLPVWLCEWVMWHIQRDMSHRPNSAKDALDKFLADESLAAQGGLGVTQQLITPSAPRTATGPVLIIPGTGPQTVHSPVTPRGTITSPLANVAPGQLSVNPALTNQTGPQPILTPAGAPSTNTSTQRLQPPTPPGALRPPPAPVNASKGPPPRPGAPAPVPAQPAVASPTPPLPTAEQPQLTPEEEIQILATQNKSLSKTNKIVILSMLVVAIIIASIVLIIKGDTNDNNKTYNRLIKNIQGKEELPVTKDELNVLLNGIVGTANVKDRIGAYIAFTKLKSADESFSAPLHMTKFALSEEAALSPEARKKLFEAISFNKPYHQESFRMMLQYAKQNPDSPAAEQAIGQLRKVIADSLFDDVLAVHDTTKELNTKTKCVNIMVDIIEKSKNKSALSKKLVARYNAAKSEVDKLSYVRIMGATGANDSMAILTKNLKSSNAIHVQSATRGLAKWPNIKPYDALVDAYANSGSNSSKIRKDIFTFLDTNDNATNVEKIAMWKKLIKAAPDNRETRQIIGVIANKQTDVSKAVLQYVLTIPNFDEKSKEHAQEKLRKNKK